MGDLGGCQVFVAVATSLGSNPVITASALVCLQPNINGQVVINLGTLGIGVTGTITVDCPTEGFETFLVTNVAGVPVTLIVSVNEGCPA